MFRRLYRPSSGYTLPYFKVNYTIYTVFVKDISCTSVKSAFKNNYSSSTVKSYFEVKDINSEKIGFVISGGWGGRVLNWVYFCLATLVFCGVTVNCLPGSAVSPWQMLRRNRSPSVVVELVSRRWWVHMLPCVQSRFECWFWTLECLLRPCGNAEWRFTLFCFLSVNKVARFILKLRLRG